MEVSTGVLVTVCSGRSTIRENRAKNAVQAPRLQKMWDTNSGDCPPLVAGQTARPGTRHPAMSMELVYGDDRATIVCR